MICVCIQTNGKRTQLQTPTLTPPPKILNVLQRLYFLSLGLLAPLVCTHGVPVEVHLRIADGCGSLVLLVCGGTPSSKRHEVLEVLRTVVVSVPQGQVKEVGAGVHISQYLGPHVLTGINPNHLVLTLKVIHYLLHELAALPITQRGPITLRIVVFFYVNPDVVVVGVSKSLDKLFSLDNWILGGAGEEVDVHEVDTCLPCQVDHSLGIGVHHPIRPIPSHDQEVDRVLILQTLEVVQSGEGRHVDSERAQGDGCQQYVDYTLHKQYRIQQ